MSLAAAALGPAPSMPLVPIRLSISTQGPFTLGAALMVGPRLATGETAALTLEGLC